jgi:hypothetical protein
MGLLKLAEKYTPASLEAACKKALTYTASPSYKSISSILAAGSASSAETMPQKPVNSHYGITRGADYYRRR